MKARRWGALVNVLHLSVVFVNRCKLNSTIRDNEYIHLRLYDVDRLWLLNNHNGLGMVKSLLWWHNVLDGLLRRWVIHRWLASYLLPLSFLFLKEMYDYSFLPFSCGPKPHP